MKNKNKYLSVSEIAKMLGISKSAAYNLVYCRRIPYSTIGRRYVINPVDLEAYIQKNRIEAL